MNCTRRTQYGVCMATALVLCAMYSVTVTAALQPGDPATAETVKVEIEQWWQQLYGETAPAYLPPPEAWLFQTELLEKATPDECYYGLGDVNNAYPFDFEEETCFGTPKVNQGYIWGMTSSPGKIWYGTVSNMLCRVMGGIAAQTDLIGPIESRSFACEFEEGMFSVDDWRPAEFYVYDIETGVNENITPDDPLVMMMDGVRSAGAVGDIVFMSGPARGAVVADVEGVCMFAFNATTGEYLGSHFFTDYSNIRRWTAVGDHLYTAVMHLDGMGRVLRWTGTVEDPFQFVEVGTLGSDGAYINEFDGRLFVTTWSDLFKPPSPLNMCALYRSPIIPPEGLPESADMWEMVWTVNQYEADDVTAFGYMGGALHSFDGWLYWGTMHVPAVAGSIHQRAYDLGTLEFAIAVLGSHRPVSVFRGKNFGTPEQEIQLLYGLSEMPAYVENPLPFGPDRIWLLLPNRMGQSPMWGLAGFGNFYNTYVWTMEEGIHGLFTGTFDWSYIAQDMIASVVGEFPGLDLPPFSNPGADLYVIRSSDLPAIAADLEGLGNHTNYGIRTMMPGEDTVYFGMANPMNLLTDPYDEMPQGGWEFRRLELDCNHNGAPDNMDLQTGFSLDCNSNGVPDECDLDCNTNGIADDCEIADGAPDCNSNGVLDECETDCNANGIPDDCDLADGFSIDCNSNSVPDECELTGNDCDTNGVPDECDPDLNTNGIPDYCDIADGTSDDCNSNGIPDEVEADCNTNGIADECDIRDGTSQDLNVNGIPDECGDFVPPVPPIVGPAGCRDGDFDGVCDNADNCPETPNPDQENEDGDNFGDACDNAPKTANNDQDDLDDDSIGDVEDNCIETPNVAQLDADVDGVGDACDVCPFIADADQADADEDGVGDACDNCPDVANADQEDANSDGVGDACEEVEPPAPTPDNDNQNSNQNSNDNSSQDVPDVETNQGSQNCCGIFGLCMYMLPMLMLTWLAKRRVR